MRIDLCIGRYPGRPMGRLAIGDGGWVVGGFWNPPTQEPTEGPTHSFGFRLASAIYCEIDATIRWDGRPYPLISACHAVPGAERRRSRKSFHRNPSPCNAHGRSK